jgi:hypothetical protein
MVDRLIGNFGSEARDLKNMFLRMIMQPDVIDMKKLKDKPYIGKILKPDPIYED